MLLTSGACVRVSRRAMSNARRRNLSTDNNYVCVYSEEAAGVERVDAPAVRFPARLTDFPSFS